MSENFLELEPVIMKKTILIKQVMKNMNLFIYCNVMLCLNLLFYGLSESCLCQPRLGTMVVIHNNVILFAWGLLQLFSSLLFVHKL